MLTTRSKIAGVTSSWAAWTRRDGVRQIAVVVGAAAAYELARIAMQPNWAAATANARKIVDLERVLSLSWEQPIQEWFVTDLPELVRAMNLFYFVGHFVLTGVFFLWLYHRAPDGFRVFRNGFLVATAIAVFIHWRFPTAPPRIAEGPNIMDTLQLYSGIDIGSPTSTALSNPVAAVPSLHAGYAVGVGVGLIRYARSNWAKALGVVYPFAVMLTIVVTGNHFIIDAFAGIAVMAAGFAVMGTFRTVIGRKGAAILDRATRGGAVR
jgi:PAP2 superfamily